MTPDQPTQPDTEDDEIATAALDEAALFARIKNWHKASQRGYDRWKKEATEAFDFIAGHQWSDEEVSAMEDEKRPLVTFDRLGPVIDVVVGSEINNRQEASAKPRDGTDAPVAEAAGDVIEYIRDDADADDAEGDAFRDMLISGMGWFEVRVLPTGSRNVMAIDTVDPFEMRWPDGCRARNMRDAPHLGRVRSIDRLAAEELLPGRSWREIDATWARDHDHSEPNRNHPDTTYQRQASEYGEAPERVTMVEWQWIEREDVHYTQDPQTQQEVEIDAAMAAQLQSAPVTLPTGEQVMWPVRTVKERIVYRAFVGSQTVLEKIRLPVQQLGMTYFAMTGKWDRKKKVWYGITRAARDPQRYANKWLSMSVEILAAGAKGGAFYEADAFADDREAQRAWANPRGLIELNPGGLAKIQQRNPVQYPQGWDRLLQLALGAIRDSTGVNTEMLGLRDAQQAGVLEHQRKQAAVTILATYFDSLRRARKDAAEMVLALALEVLEDDELKRILGLEKEDIVPALRGAGVAQFDIIIDESPQSANAKERTWAALQPIMPMMAQMGVPVEVWIEVLRTSPLPNAFTEKVIQHLSGEQKPPDPAAEAMKEIAMRTAAAEAAKKEAEAAKTAAEVKEVEADTANTRLQSMIEAGEAGIRAGDRIGERLVNGIGGAQQGGDAR